MKTPRFTLKFAAGLLAFAASCAQAGGPLGVCTDKTAITYTTPAVALNYDGGGTLGSRTKAQADAIVTSAIGLWTAVPTATIVLSRSPTDLPVDVTVANYLPYLNSSSDGLNPVIYDTDGTIIDAVFGPGQKSFVLGFAGSTYYYPAPCRYAEGRAVINGFIAIDDTTMTVVLAHEIGHLIGLDHTQLDNSQGLTPSFPSNYPLMYPIAYRDFVSLHDDDIAAVSALYPDATLNSVYGQITGNFTLANGVTPVLGANIWARETTTNKVYSIVSDYLMQNTGYFKLLLPAGTYTLRAEAIDTQFDGGSSVGPYSDDPSGLSFQSPLYSGSTPMAALTLGNGSPIQFSITAGCAATAVFKMDGTGSIGGNCVAAPPTMYTLTLTSSGAGSGTSTSGPGGIHCGATCSASFAQGTVINIAASPHAGSAFTGWSNSCSGSGSCTVTMNSNLTVNANFDPTTIKVTRDGSGSGTVTSSPVGINCGVSCSAGFVHGAAVTLTASPAAGSVFTGWGGPCTGTGACVVNVNAAAGVTATFASTSAPAPGPTFSLTYTASGAGTGTVASAPDGLICTANCIVAFPQNSVVTLVATPHGGSFFAGWTGACSGMGSCTVTLNAAAAVVATFTTTLPVLGPPSLTIVKAGGGSGAVASTPGGYYCGTVCSAGVPAGTAITLTATPDVGSTFAGWSGACGGTGTCSLTINSPLIVTATFN